MAGIFPPWLHVQPSFCMKDHQILKNLGRVHRLIAFGVGLVIALPSFAQELPNSRNEQSQAGDSQATVLYLSTDTEAYRQNPEPARATGLWSNATQRANDILTAALAHIGVRYRFGGNTPETGFDCSGLVRWVFDRTWGVVLPRRAEEMAQLGTQVPRDQLKPGDLVFFNTLKRQFSHIGIYIGGGQFVHAPRSGGAVRVESLDQSYWQARWNGARRLENPEATAQAPRVR
ncbi:MAG TPA: C40 family peptidase [Burkholderiaceae bacterium]|nr:C40 family peptidase [Burkholderiaceae bacterium]